ncbi:MAG: polynucleotide adenylyltransferase PcnB [Betaproteobacteria bacterium]|nr:polynucleotide adenylyltransferase PcnB [Betaproteobacteria bacterium]
MIRRLLRRMFTTAPTPRLKVYPLKSHGISRDRISSCALRTTEGLQRGGHSAFVVGGAVRDLLLGRDPKDFDLATGATPEEVRGLFRRSRIIGRRFRLVHVMCGPETVEVSTFRGTQGDGEEGDQLHDEHGRILRDNVFGSQEQDATRRDFTVNALFYDPAKQEIWDYYDGMRDLKARRLRMIGDPEPRYREDPVRLLRAVRLAAKLGMEIDRATAEPIRRLAPLIEHVPAARVFDEMLKLLLSGHAAECVKELRRRGLHHGLLPMLDVILEQPLGERFVMLALRSTDERILEDKPVSPAFLFAALLWHEVLAAWKKLGKGGMKPMPALHQAMDQVLGVQDEKLAIPRRYDAVIKEMWAMQPRFEQRAGRRPFRLLEHERFRAAYDFLRLRCESGEVDPALGRWWEEFQHASPERREHMLVAEEAPKARRRRRRGPRGGGGAAPAAAAGS